MSIGQKLIRVGVSILAFIGIGGAVVMVIYLISNALCGMVQFPLYSIIAAVVALCLILVIVGVILEMREDVRTKQTCNKCGSKKLEFYRIYLDPYTDYSGWVEKRCKKCGH